MNYFHRFLNVILLLMGILIIKCSAKDSCKDEGTFKNCTLVSGGLRLSDAHFNKSTTHLWVINSNEKSLKQWKTVNLFFTELFLHEGDKITIYKSLNDSNDTTKSIADPIVAQNGSVTLLTDEVVLVVKLEGTDRAYQRKFDCLYTASETCAFAIPPDVSLISSPKYLGNKKSAKCKYMYNHDAKKRVTPLFQFEIFNFTSSQVELEETTYPTAVYEKDKSIGFFPKDDNPMSLDVILNNMTDYFRLRVKSVDSVCSKYIEIKNHPESIKSPDYALDDGTFGNECVWIAKHQDDSKVLSVAFTKLDLKSVLDIVAINQGGSEMSQPLSQITTSNANQSLVQELWSSNSLLWISFKPQDFNSVMAANITFHGQGGYYRDSGIISMKSTVGNDTVFMLEVDDNKSVLLNFTSSEMSSSATLSIYDGFDTKHLIAILQGHIWYPVVSPSSRMMIVATSFSTSSFNATFSGVIPGCLHTSTITDDHYVLSGNCNNTCMWIIPPQNVPNSLLLLNLQYVSLESDDVVEIYRLDNGNVPIGTVNSSLNHVPQIALPSTIGALISISRKKCSKEDSVILVGHSSLVPACGGTVDVRSSETFHIMSPLHPDTYPLYANCTWMVSSPTNSLIHLSFDELALAPNHCVKIMNSRTNTSIELIGSQLPKDLFLSNGSTVQFTSSKCKDTKAHLQLVSSVGFMLTGIVAECGAVLENKLSGEFTVNVSSIKQSLCIWKVTVPPTTDDTAESVNIITYTMTVKDDKGNYELKVFDGASVRDPEISNTSTTETIWSRTNELIFTYKRLNISQPSSVFIIGYKALTCNSSMLCDNKMCMHPNWRCNGINECGDFTDEKDCASVPLPPDVKLSGFSASSFWAAFICMFIVGALLGFGIPAGIQKYKNGQYHRFSDISVIE